MWVVVVVRWPPLSAAVSCLLCSMHLLYYVLMYLNNGEQEECSSKNVFQGERGSNRIHRRKRRLLFAIDYCRN